MKTYSVLVIILDIVSVQCTNKYLITGKGESQKQAKMKEHNISGKFYIIFYRSILRND